MEYRCTGFPVDEKNVVMIYGRRRRSTYVSNTTGNRGALDPEANAFEDSVTGSTEQHEEAAATPPARRGDATGTGSGPRLAGPDRSTLAGRPAHGWGTRGRGARRQSVCLCQRRTSSLLRFAVLC